MVSIRRPSGGGKSSAVAAQAKQILIQQGVSPKKIVETTYSGGSSSPVVVTFVRSVAVTKECGAWNNLAYQPNNEPYDNFGCAHQHNIAAMVANPNDLVAPQAMTPPEPGMSSLAIDDYRGYASAAGAASGGGPRVAIPAAARRAAIRAVAILAAARAEVIPAATLRRLNENSQEEHERTDVVMQNQALEMPVAAQPADQQVVASIPRINIHIFCDNPQTAATMQAAAADRRMSRAHVTIQMGGINGAVQVYQSAGTPNLLMVESHSPRDLMLAELMQLAQVCQPNTKVVVIGHLTMSFSTVN